MNRIFNEDVLLGIDKIENNSVDLILTDPPYCLGKDYGNDSDQKSAEDYLNWTYQWIDAALPKLKTTGSFYIFLSWQYSPEIFVYLKKKLRMVNEIIWDRRVPSMGGSTRKFSSVHDNIGFFVRSNDYYFDLDSIRIPYDEGNQESKNKINFCWKKMARDGLQPQGFMEHFTNTCSRS